MKTINKDATKIDAIKFIILVILKTGDKIKRSTYSLV